MNQRWHTIGKRLGILAIIVSASVLSIYLWYRHDYPYGQSHCCSLAVQDALMEYAESHDGRFPHGESSPEASLSLLYKEGLSANTLRGMIVPEKTTRSILESGHLLTPETCGWHYVEGLGEGAMTRCGFAATRDRRHMQKRPGTLRLRGVCRRALERGNQA